ncbi:MAG: hypothetical protein ABSD85_07660 [Acidimicrobiales bacterium]
MRVSKLTSVLIFTQMRSVTITGTFEQLESAYKKVLTHHLLTG